MATFSVRSIRVTPQVCWVIGVGVGLHSKSLSLRRRHFPEWVAVTWRNKWILFILVATVKSVDQLKHYQCLSGEPNKPCCQSGTPEGGKSLKVRHTCGNSFWCQQGVYGAKGSETEVDQHVGVQSRCPVMYSWLPKCFPSSWKSVMGFIA